jgi:hypothetical protein
MTKPAVKTAAQPLVHHPSDALDLFCRYDGSHEAWAQFDQSLSEQLRDFEATNRAWFTPRAIRSEFKKSLGR